MSRFFRNSDSESDSDTSSDNDSLYSQSDSEFDSDAESYHSEAEQQQQQPRNRFLKGETDSEDSDDESNRKRQAKSQKDKRIEEMETAVKAIENGQKNNDWNLIATEFDKLTITISRATTGFNAIPLPKFYIKTIVELEDHLAENLQKDKTNKKKGSNSKAMNNLKQKLKKISKQYDEPIAAYKKDPEEFMKEVEVEERPSSPMKKKEIAPQANVAASIADDDEGFTSVGKGGKSIVSVTSENLLGRLREVLESRGKKNTDRNEQVTILEALLENAQSPFQKISVLLALISYRFDIVTASKEAYMDNSKWNSAAEEFNYLLKVLETNKSFVVTEDADDLDNEDRDVVPKEGEVVKIRGSILSFVERLDDEFSKSLQNMDPHSTDYIDRLGDEPSVYAMLDRAQVYCEVNNIAFALPRIIARKLDHVYYKPEKLITALQTASKKLLPTYIVSKVITAEEPAELVNQLCNYLYKDDSTIFRTRAMLCHIYHYALHKKYYTARDLLLMSHVQDSIHQADIATQILYNRTMVQVGICAFREGLVKESYAALSEIQNSGRVKELLAQGVQAQRFNQPANPELDAIERQRQLPFHMHINLELLECIFLTCSMLLEIPAQAQAGPNNNKKNIISRPFRRLLDYNERQAFCGPPETTRDHIMSAAKALASGEWEKARDFMLAIKVWDLMTEVKEIKEMLVLKIQEEGLRTYLFTYCSYYTTLGLEQLSTMFGLSVNRVSALVAKMIFDEELAASLDQVSQCIVLHQVEPSRLQVLALQYSEKVANLVDQNERLIGNAPNNNNNNNTSNTNANAGFSRTNNRNF
ncbi:eukaryotic translation initiation factor 3 subunit 8 N-terminus-domain-containing protein [Cokeromyces recurvatus]|uniref:eukaryotic translation initiation factor 3 subunit 8 N-terminus-domain-containing protein n=1 Tax=Cokeromyces recurvatus TaxID=90255 RepID=UPI0022208AA3|nr:eukaryotic translation initiation factor 3 subunit 8 N-terminus-domain-containing protein [Cokeromyces recurvatus]KAI7904241.1 eukaryotic translation initiation factor 3 subunit 8 N-terminus-domain-containing protein [Cokeromyces recurvatus]